MMRATSYWMAGVAGLSALSASLGCSGAQTTPGGSGGEAHEAEATIEPRSDSKVTGSATFTSDGGVVTLKVDVTGATPGVHAIHVHEHPDCTSPDAESAGGHWNPTMKEHGRWGEGSFHLGDIGNLTVGPDGNGSLTFTTDLWSVGTGKPNDVEGHALVIHADPDDFTTQPSGNAGKRIACGVIRGK